MESRESAADEKEVAETKAEVKAEAQTQAATEVLEKTAESQDGSEDSGETSEVSTKSKDSADSSDSRDSNESAISGESSDIAESKESSEADDDSEEKSPLSVEVLDEASQPFEGRWNQLISTTNWEKGQIIFDWREALQKKNVPATECSDEAWARRVGGVTGQHIGRLRRVFEKFGQNYTQYQGLYWSHFQAAIDWEDAEMWLEGSVQNGWSVSKMRKARWEALGAPDELKPREEDIITSELNEDLDVREDREPQIASEFSAVDDPGGPVGPDFGDEEEDPPFDLPSGNEDGEPHVFAEDEQPTVKPFESIPDLPEDVGEAFESLKLSILRHKTDNWNEISQEDMLSALDALKELAIAPAGIAT